MRNIPLKSLAFLVISSIFLYSCGKSGTYPTIPQITFKSINPQEVHKSLIPDQAPAVQITLGIRAAGNLAQDSVYVSQSNVPAPPLSFPMPTNIPDQKGVEGNVVINLSKYQVTFSNSNPAGDTVHYAIFIMDQSGKVISDTVNTSRIVLFNN